MTIEDVGKFLDGMFIVSPPVPLFASKETYGISAAVPINLKEQDAFHLTIEEYLLALIAMVEELVSTLLSRSFKSIVIDIFTVSSGGELGYSR